MASLQAVRDGLTALNSQVGSGDLMAAIIMQLVTMVDVIMGTEQQSAAEIRNLRDECAQTRGGLEILSAGKGGTRREHPILESKAVQGLKMFTGDKVDFRTWLDRLVNVLAQVRTGSRKMLKVMMEYVDKDLGGAHDV